jgi:hypothetical protein
MEDFYKWSAAFLCRNCGENSWICIMYRSVLEWYTLGVNWKERGKSREGR